MSQDLLAKHFKKHFDKWNAGETITKEVVEVKKEIYKPDFILAEQVLEDALPIIKSNEFYGLSYIGGQGQGKSFSAAQFATMVKGLGFLIIYGKAEDIVIDLEQWKGKVKEKILENQSQFITFILDDFSYATGTVSSKKAATWKHFVGDIRHQFEKVLNDDYKPNIFLIFISHRYHSVPPIMRNAASWIFGSMLPEDRQDAQKLIPKNKEELEKLDEIYKFIQEVSSLGPKYKDIPLSFGYGQDATSFRWGDKEDPGDGRLMMIYHQGHMKIFNPKQIDNMVNLDEYRILYVPPKPEEIEEKKKKNFEDNARKITEVINNKTITVLPLREITCGNCNYTMKTRRKEGESIQCSKCNKQIEKRDVPKLLGETKPEKTIIETGLEIQEEALEFEEITD